MANREPLSGWRVRNHEQPGDNFLTRSHLESPQSQFGHGYLTRIHQSDASGAGPRHAPILAGRHGIEPPLLIERLVTLNGSREIVRPLDAAMSFMDGITERKRDRQTTTADRA